MTTTTTNAKFRNVLEEHFSSVSLRNGEWTVRQPFFYRHNGSPEGVWQKLVKLSGELNVTFTMIDMGEVWKPFKGGAPVTKQSHWFVKFRVVEKELNPKPTLYSLRLGNGGDA